MASKKKFRARRTLERTEEFRLRVPRKEDDRHPKGGEPRQKNIRHVRRRHGLPGDSKQAERRKH